MMRRRRNNNGLGRLLAAGFAVAASYVFAREIPQLRRYLKIRFM